MITQDQILKEIKNYQSTGRLTTHPYLKCTVTGEDVMSFGPMLKKKIDKYGGLEILLKTFVSRKAKSILKGPKPVKIRKSRKKEILEKSENQIYIIPPFRNEPPQILSLKENPEHTLGACLRPDIFLNSGKVCDDCFMSSYCQSTCKKFSNRKNKYSYV